MLQNINDNEGRLQNKCWNLGPQLPCYATGVQTRLRNMLPIIKLDQLYEKKEIDQLKKAMLSGQRFFTRKSQ